ncbi:tetraspanin-8-like [Plectropomus leopardus]|uniref:tetraspanin-8-like n=1 Tax=Plectropomus leopardus TaxID=160734 RepID=UPI001C4CFED0|nr:tetraspanin-8-like [Plectropomus leopardus]
MTVNKPLKYLLFTFNFLFFVGGIIILTLSTHVRSNKADYQITDDLLLAVNLLIFVGAVTLIFGFLGCCGAFQESRCLLALFFLGLLSMFIMLLAVGVLGAVSRTTAAQELVQEHLKQLLPLSEQPKEVQDSFQSVELNGFCCGLFVGHLDWGNSTMVPDSCNCTDTFRNCTVLEDREIYSTPCMVYLMTWFDRVSETFVVTAITFAVVMILGIILSLVLFCQIMKKKLHI